MDHPFPTIGNRLRPAWLAVLIAVLVAGVFAGARHGGFLNWDDDINIVRNPHLEKLSGSELRWMFTDATYMRRYVPLAWLGWAAEREFFGLTAKSAHIGNILLHALNAALVFFVLRRMGRAVAEPKRVPSGVMAVAAVLGALLWALHPLRVEVVAWASGRMYTQAACFLLVALLAYFRACVEGVRAGPRRVWLAISVLGFGASLLTYPIGIMLPLLLVAIDGWVLRRFHAGGWRDPRNRVVWLEKIPFVLIAALVGLATLAARFGAQGIWEPPPTLAQFSLGARFAQACYVWMYYVWKPLFPANLVPVYTTLVGFNPVSATFIVSVLGLVGVTAVLVWRRRQWPAMLALWAAHLLVLLPVLGITEQPHYASDRYSYLQGILWSVLLVGGTVQLWPWLSRRATLFGGFGLAVASALAFASIGQVRLWRDNETFFKALYHTVGDSRYRADIAMRLGDFMRMENRPAEAAEYYRESLRIIPNNARSAISHFGLGSIAHAGQRWQEAADHYQIALQLNPRLVEASRAFGELLLQRGMPAEAAQVLQRATAIAPRSPELQEMLGVALYQVGKVPDAINAFAASVQVRPTSVGTLCNLAAALSAAGRAPEAIGVAREAVRLGPLSPEPHWKLGEALRMAGQLPDAIAALREAARLQPKSAGIMNSLGTAHAASGDLPRAVEAYRLATQLEPNLPDSHYNLGLALRHSGQAEEAAIEFNKALQLRPDYQAAREELARLKKS